MLTVSQIDLARTVIEISVLSNMKMHMRALKSGDREQIEALELISQDLKAITQHLSDIRGDALDLEMKAKAAERQKAEAAAKVSEKK